MGYTPSTPRWVFFSLHPGGYSSLYTQVGIHLSDTQVGIHLSDTRWVFFPFSPRWVFHPFSPRWDIPLSYTQVGYTPLIHPGGYSSHYTPRVGIPPIIHPGWVSPLIHPGGYPAYTPGRLGRVYFPLFYPPRKAKKECSLPVIHHPGRLRRRDYARYSHPGRLRREDYARYPHPGRLGRRNNGD